MNTVLLVVDMRDCDRRVTDVHVVSVPPPRSFKDNLIHRASTMAPEETEDVKPKLDLTISYEGQTCQVKVRNNTPFKKVFEAAEKRFGKEPGTFKFEYDGSRLLPQDTPASHNMESGDIIEAHLEQVGGGLVGTG